MIKIRYRDADELSPGLHAAAEQDGRNTTVFLVPGLTAAERRAALRRLRLSARMGYCPPLPAVRLAFALVADRIRTTVGQVGTLIRSHPAGSTVPVMVLSAGAIAFLALSAVSIQVLHIPRDPGRSSGLAVAGNGSHAGVPGSSPADAQPTAGGPGPADPVPGQVSSTSPAATSSPGSRPSVSAGPSPSPSPSATTSSGTANPTPSLRAPTPANPAASPTASPTVTPAMQVPSPTPTSTCLNVGPVGVCP